MFTSEDILARLQDGDSVDVIATEMANALNAAKTAYDEAEAKRIEEEKKLEAEKANREARAKAKRVVVTKMIDSVIELANMESKHDLADKLTTLTDTELNDIAEAINMLFELVETIDKFKVLEYGMPKSILIGDKAENLPKLAQKVVKRTPDDIISEFLKTL